MSKNKCNMVINKLRLAKDHLQESLMPAQDIDYPIMTQINKTILEIELITNQVRHLRATYE
jgi:hypothetical protein